MANAGPGPWFVDLSSNKSRPGSVVTASSSTPTWIRASDDCSTGATLSVRDRTVASVIETIRAADGTAEAVLLQPHAPGSTTVTVTQNRRRPRSVTVVVKR